MECSFIKNLLEELSLKSSNIKRIEKGWSNKQKYIIETENEAFNLSIFDVVNYNRYSNVFKFQKELYELGSKVAKPIDIFIFKDKGVALYEFIQGLDGEVIINTLSKQNQYDIGFQAGLELKKIHSLKPPTPIDWKSIKIRKHNRYLEVYNKVDYKLENEKEILKFIESNLDVLGTRDSTIQHDDYHLGNMIIDNGKLSGIIDFDLFDFGDPYHDFIKAGNISVCTSEYFCKGQIDGYFSPYKPDTSFWLTYSVYGAMSVISTVAWLKKYHPSRFDEGMEGIYKMLSDHENFNKIIPKWYEGE